MKTWKLTLGVLIAAMAIVGQAKAYTINDNYWGGTVVPSTYAPWGETIGSPNFGIETMDIVKSGKDWTVTITGEYLKEHDSGSYDSGYPYLLAPGDLYINSNGWNVHSNSGGTESATVGGEYKTDTFTESEGWNYVVSKNGTSWGLYSLVFDSTLKPTNVSTLPSGNYIYRQNQAWQGGIGIGTTPTLIGTANYAHISDTYSSTFTFNTGNLDFSGDVGFHWTMQCGNDVIEGKVNVPAVPEPATLLLLGLGLLGLGVSSRKLRK